MARRKLSRGANRMAALVKRFRGDFKAASRAYRANPVEVPMMLNSPRRTRRRNPWVPKPPRKTFIRSKHRIKRYWLSKMPGRTKAGRFSKRKPMRHYRAPKGYKRFHRARRYKMAANPLLMSNPRRSRRNRPSRGLGRLFRNPVSASGIFPVKSVLSLGTLQEAGWTAGGAFVTMSLPGLIRRFLPAGAQAQMDRFSVGLPGIAMMAASATLTTGLASLIPMSRRRAKEIAIGGMIATVIKAGGELIPQFWPLAMSAQPLKVPGVAGLGDVVDRIVDQVSAGATPRLGVSDYDSGLSRGGFSSSDYSAEGLPTGVSDWDTGMNGLADYDSGLSQVADESEDMV